MISSISQDLIERMRDQASDAMMNAYCPYSHFKVGAAVLGTSGRVYSGCNVENISLGLTICAERNAVFQAIAAGEKELLALVIVSPDDEPVMPCGACLQVVNEFGVEQDVISFSPSGRVIRISLRELLPNQFSRPTDTG